MPSATTPLTSATGTVPKSSGTVFPSKSSPASVTFSLPVPQF
jgi:hypothetical protein